MEDLKGEARGRMLAAVPRRNRAAFEQILDRRLARIEALAKHSGPNVARRVRQDELERLERIARLAEELGSELDGLRPKPVPIPAPGRGWVLSSSPTLVPPAEVSDWLAQAPDAFREYAHHLKRTTRAPVPHWRAAPINLEIVALVDFVKYNTGRPQWNALAALICSATSDAGITADRLRKLWGSHQKNRKK